MMAVGPRPDDGHDKEFMNTLVKELAVSARSANSGHNGSHIEQTYVVI